MKVLTLMFLLSSPSAGDDGASFVTNPENGARIQLAQNRGCCKEWDRRNRRWREIHGLSFRECQRENQRRDDDDVRDKNGYIWWDDRC